MQKPRFYLGANSPEGFYGYFQKAYGPDWKVWLIKGGPGSGKSTLMRRITERVPGSWEEIRCSSDPASLDAAICEEKKVMLADATSPHVLEAGCPGCVEQLVDLGEGFDIAALRRTADPIRYLAGENKAFHRQAVHYLAAAAQVQCVRMEQAADKLDREAVRSLAKIWFQRLELQNGPCGKVRQRGLCAVTPEGVLCFEDTVGLLCDRIFVLQDDWGAAAPVFLACLCDALNAAGCGYTLCNCSLFPKNKPEHLLLPHSRIAFVTGSHAHLFTMEHGTNIDLRDMYGAHRPGTKDALQRILAQETHLLEAAAGCMYQARLVHDELERYYISAMDFSFVQKKTEKLAAEICAAVE